MTARQGWGVGVVEGGGRQQAGAEVDTAGPLLFQERSDSWPVIGALECEQKVKASGAESISCYVTKPCHGTWDEAAMEASPPSNPPLRGWQLISTVLTIPILSWEMHPTASMSLCLTASWAHFFPMFPRVGMQGQKWRSVFLLSLVLNSDKSVQAASELPGGTPLLCLDAELPCVGSGSPDCRSDAETVSSQHHPWWCTVGLCFPSLHLDNDKSYANTDIKRAVCQAHVRYYTG